MDVTQKVTTCRVCGFPDLDGPVSAERLQQHLRDEHGIGRDEDLHALFAGLPLFAGRLRVKITLEREDGTELLHAYLPRTVRFGDQVEMKFTAGEIS